MKKIFSYAMIIAASFALVACGGEEKKSDDWSSESRNWEVKIKPSTTEVSGSLKGCFEVVDREYKLKSDGFGADVIITLKRTAMPLPFDVNEEVVAYGTCCTDRPYITVGFGLECYDADGDIVAKDSYDSPYSHEEAVCAVKLLDGDTATITYSLYEDEEEMKKITSFKVTSSYAFNQPAPAVSESSDDDIFESVSSTSSNILDAASEAANSIVNSAKAVYEESDLDDAIELVGAAAKASGAALDAAAAAAALGAAADLYDVW
jgi:hypothetical protein